VLLKMFGKMHVVRGVTAEIRTGNAGCHGIIQR